VHDSKIISTPTECLPPVVSPETASTFLTASSSRWSNKRSKSRGVNIIEEAYTILSKPEDEFGTIDKAVTCKLQHVAESQRYIAEHLCSTVMVCRIN
jgi:hypothetical protein